MFERFGRMGISPHTKVAGFVEHLAKGELMGSRCTDCGYRSFPPRSDCPECLSGEWEFVPVRGEGTVLTYSTIAAAPAGFQQHAPYTVGVVELVDGGRLLAWFDASVSVEDVSIGMKVAVVPEDLGGDDERVSYRLELGAGGRRP